MVDLQFMKLPLSGDFSVFKLLFGMACACVSIATVFASTDLVGPALATSLEASRGDVDLEPLIDALGADGLRRRLAGALPRAPGGAVLHARALQVPHEEAQARLARPSTGAVESTSTGRLARKDHDSLPPSLR